MHFSNKGRGRSNMRKSPWTAQLGLLASISCTLAYFVHIPVFLTIPFIKYDPADIPILIAALLFGPSAGLLITAAVSVIQGLFVEGGMFDMIMHILATGLFQGPSTCRKKH